MKDESKAARACDACYETVFPLLDVPLDDNADSGGTDSYTRGEINNDTLGTLSGFPSWLSMPTLHVTSNAMPAPQALMAIDLDHDRGRESITPSVVVEEPLKGRRWLRPRPRSHHQFLEDSSFEDQDKEKKFKLREGDGERFDVVNVLLEEGEGEGEGNVDGKKLASSPLLSSSPRKENTARRVKRFSLPAVALQTTSVTARTEFVEVDDYAN